MIVSMGTPQFILNLRKKIGHDELWLPGVTGVILRSGDGGGGEGTAQEVLLVQRSDNHHWTPVTGICEPSEQPDTAIMREALEETGLQIQVDRLLWVQAIDALTYINGDVASGHRICLFGSPRHIVYSSCCRRGERRSWLVSC